MNFPIYKSEVDAGLSDKILASTSFAFQLSPTIQQFGSLSDSMLKSIADNVPNLAKTSIDGDRWDLYHLNSILVSIGWNRNDDVFDAGETWNARNSPVHKQVNYMHNEKDIIGHIVSSAIFVDGKQYNDNTTPDKFDIIVGSVLYRKWEDADLQKRMNDLISGIAKGEWFVSMECLLRNFDYAMQTPDGQQKIVARNASTAFLTKHLRLYGGTGEYQGNKIGRLLRNFTFSGKGIVSNPANPRSFILTDDVIPFKANSTITSISPKEETKVMADTDNTLRDELAQAKARNEKLEAKLEQLVEAARTAERAKLEAEIASHKVDIQDLSKKVAAHEKTIAEKDTAIADTQKQLKAEADKNAELTKQIIAAKAEAVKAGRISKLVEVGVESAKAEDVVSKWSTASDEQFADVVSLHEAAIAKKKAEDVKEEPEKGKADDDGDDDDDKKPFDKKGDKSKGGSAEEYKKKTEEEYKKGKSATADLDKAKADVDPALGISGDTNDGELVKAAANWMGSLLRGTQSIKKETQE